MAHLVLLRNSFDGVGQEARVLGAAIGPGGWSGRRRRRAVCRLLGIAGTMRWSIVGVAVKRGKGRLGWSLNSASARSGSGASLKSCHA